MNRFTHSFRFLTVILLTGAWGILPVDLHAAQLDEAPQKPVVVEQLFTSPDEAVKALQAAAENEDKEALRQIFGPQVQELLTGDKVQDANNAQRFATAMAQGYTFMKEGEDRIDLEVGLNKWPMPIPLVKANGQWYFDTAAGKEEIINRHIGKDELHAIGVCRAYVTAQQQYASTNPEASRGVKYAQKFKSTPGKRDGLYWPSVDNEQPSPFGSLVAEAYAEGYLRNKGKGPYPFHGYYFRILTRQGKAGSGGKMNYMTHGDLTRGFALVAYPANWDHSGIMTFIVNQDGQVFQRNFGDKTFQIARAMKEYNPDSEWMLVQDNGVLNAASEK
jgi:hypothetical protein